MNKDGEIEKERDRKKQCWVNKNNNRQIEIKMNRWTDRNKDEQMDRQK